MSVSGSLFVDKKTMRINQQSMQAAYKKTKLLRNTSLSCIVGFSLRLIRLALSTIGPNACSIKLFGVLDDVPGSVL